MTTLRERCEKFAAENFEDREFVDIAPERIDALQAFVLAERGRAADPKLEGSLPLVMYCGDEASRQKLIDAFKEAHPNVRTKRMP